MFAVVAVSASWFPEVDWHYALAVPIIIATLTINTLAGLVTAALVTAALVWMEGRLAQSFLSSRISQGSGPWWHCSRYHALHSGPW